MAKNLLKRTITFYCKSELVDMLQKRADNESEGNISMWLRKLIVRELKSKKTDRCY